MATRGSRQFQRRAVARAENPEQLVQMNVRIPDRLRAKAREAAATLGISTNAYLEQLLEQAPMPDAQGSLPLAESA